ncbi:MAG: Glucan endo,3-beta-D-glucosidase [Chitinophagaceae bacterium]|nr:Glucan endo,3-beta-D-glucosidase [Chitinophagaceae bacterium]
MLAMVYLLTTHTFNMTRFLSIAFVFLVFGTVSFAQPLHPCAELIWYDEFNGSTLDAAKWTPQLGDGCDIDLCGWGNDELEYYTDRTENVKVENGNLVITSLKETFGTRDYTSAKLRSIHKGDFTYGRIEARMKLPQGEGSWPAFWMLSTDETYGSWPQSGEIDIMEYQGKDPNAISGTVHYGDPYPGNKYKGLVYRLDADGKYYDDFHTFTLDWDSTSIKWYMDGNLYHTFTKITIIPYHWPFDQEFYIILNNAIGGFLGGPVDDASFPQVTLVDYVRVYSSPLNFKILGNQRVLVNASNQVYYVPTAAGATDYQWSVPAGASIVSGQGTSSITVNWGGTSSAGNIVLNIVKACGSLNRTLAVTVLDEQNCKLVLDDMDGNTNISYDTWTTSRFATSYANPVKTGINTSNTIGYLIKTNTTGTNQFTINQLPIHDSAPYEAGQRIFYMDVYCNANPGAAFELRFQNKAKASGTYPAGTRTILKATTSVVNQWERLVFKFDRTEDMSTLTTEVDQIAVVFNPIEAVVNKYYYFDNLQIGLLPYNVINGYTDLANCDILNAFYSVTNNPSSNYQWTVPTGFSILDGQNTSDIDITWSGLSSGRIYVQETISGCSLYTGTLDIKVLPCTDGILGGENIQALTIYPNPSRDQLTVTCALPSPTDVKLIISSWLGETLMTKNYSGQSGTFNEQFSVQELKPGSYIIQLVTGSDIRASQLIKY